MLCDTLKLPPNLCKKPNNKQIKHLPDGILMLFTPGLCKSLFCSELHPDKKTELKDFRSHLIDSTTELPTLKVWQLQGECFLVVCFV